MLFSVVVPVYNPGAYLEGCISSILGQTFRDFELILVDDGSTDGSGAVCSRYAGGKVTVIHQENRGHTAARYRGVRQARGDYILFADSDDMLPPDFLENIQRALREHPAELIQCGMGAFRAGKCLGTYPFYPAEGVYDASRIRQKVFPCLMMDERGHSFPRALCAKAIRREIAEKALAQVPRDIKIGEDMCCVIAMFQNIRSLCIVPGACYGYRVGHTSLSNSGDGDAYLDCRRLLKCLERLTQMDPDCLYPQYLRLAVDAVYSATLIALRAENVQTVRRKYGMLRKECDLDGILQAARFISPKFRIKVWLLRYQCFGLIRLTDGKNRRRAIGCGRAADERI